MQIQDNAVYLGNNKMLQGIMLQLYPLQFTTALGLACKSNGDVHLPSIKWS